MSCLGCGTNKKNNWSILVKPTHDCNFDCKYCYDKPLRDKYKGKRMSLKLLKEILDKVAAYTTDVQWIWHGGEPTLMGIEWYREAQELMYSYRDRLKIKQSMQSNGYLLNREWMEFLEEYDIEIGMSFDATEQDLRCKNTTGKLIDTLKMFNEEGPGIGTITVINKKNVKHQIEIYEYLKSLEVSPSFNHVFSSAGTKKFDLEVETDIYAEESEKLFRHILFDKDINASTERTTNLMFNQVVGNRQLVCTFTDCREAWISVNAVGDIYPCDRHLPDRYFIGNIKDFETIQDVYKSKGHKLYSIETQQRFMTHCRECGFLSYCQGGCNANHIMSSKSGTAKDIDEFSCNLFKKNFYSMYKIIRDINFYENELSLPFTKKIIEEPVITLNEIKEFLSSKGFNTDFEYIPEGKELLSCTEFKIFRIFNPLMEGNCGHVNMTKYQMDININILKDKDLSVLKEERFKYMDYIFKEKIGQILSLLKK